MVVKIYSREELEKMSKKPFQNNTSIISELDKSDYSDFPFKLFDDKIAEKIVDFVYKTKDETDTMIVQCEFGESRSAAVAAAILENLYKKGNDIFSNKKYSPNMFVYRILMKKFNEKTKK